MRILIMPIAHLIQFSCSLAMTFPIFIFLTVVLPMSHSPFIIAYWLIITFTMYDRLINLKFNFLSYILILPMGGCVLLMTLHVFSQYLAKAGWALGQDTFTASDWAAGFQSLAQYYFAMALIGYGLYVLYVLIAKPQTARIGYGVFTNRID